MKRVLVGGFHHESNSLSQIISTEKDFKVIRGEEITENIVPNSSLSGIVMTLKAAGMVGYKTAPHIDCTETGVKAAEMTLFYLNTGIIPKTSTVKIPMILAGEKSGTDVVSHPAAPRNRSGR